MLQDLCPTLSPQRQTRPWVGAWALWVLTLLLLSPTAHAKERTDPTLLDQVQAWVAQQQGVEPSQIKTKPLDKRIPVPACLSGWTFEAPFPGQASVRAQCESPKAQLFVQWTSLRVKLTLPAPTRQSMAPVMTTKSALAASRTLPRGSHLDESMVQWVEVPAGQWSAHHLSDLSVVQGSQLMRDMVPGQVIRRQDIRPSVLVKKGQMVSFQVGQSANFMITATVQALQDGRMGEQIRLKNPDSGRILSGVVTGLNAVKTP
ncbi:FlgA Flagellar basal body P-ring biosynthesis protein [Burkholderiaceae bacterium]